MGARALPRAAATLLLPAAALGQAAVNAVNGLNVGGGTAVADTTPVVTYTTDYAAAAVCDKDGTDYPSVVLGDGGALGGGRMLALGSHLFAKGDGMDGALSDGLFKSWAFRGKGAPKVVLDADASKADVKAFVESKGATVVAEELAAYSPAAGLAAKLNGDGIDVLVLVFRDGRGSPPYPTDGYEGAIVQWLKAGGSIIAAGRTTSWTWNYHAGSYRQDTGRLHPGNKIFEPVGLLWYTHGYSYGYQTTWKKVTDAKTLVLAEALKDLAAKTTTTVLTATLPAQLNLQLSTLLVVAPCSGSTAQCTDLSVFDSIWDEGKKVVEGPCKPTYEGPFPMATDKRWQTCVSALRTIWDGFPDNKLPAASVAPFAKRYPGGGYDLTAGNRKDYKVILRPYLSGWHSTGCYAAPGEQITVEIPQANVGHITTVRIGVHTDSIWERDPILRFPETLAKSKGFKEGSNTMTMKSVWGGAIWVWLQWSYIEQGNHTWLSRGTIEMTIKNVHKMLWYDHGVTTEADWDKQRAEVDAGWADMQCRTETYSIPHKSVDIDWDNLYKVCEFYWDRSIGLGENEMALQGGYWDHRSEAAVFDVQISIGYMHSGYPWMGPLSGDSNTPKSVYWSGATSAFGNLYSGNWGDLHEMGHNHDCCSWTHYAADVHTNAWVCQGYHETPVYITRCHEHVPGEGSNQMTNRYTNMLAGPCRYFADGDSDNGVPDTTSTPPAAATWCGFGGKLAMHVTIMSQMGFAAYKQHIYRGAHLQKKAGSGKYFDEQGTRMVYTLSTVTKRDQTAHFWSYSYLKIPSREYRVAVMMDKPALYTRMDTPTELMKGWMHGAAAASRTRPTRLGPVSTKTTFTNTATLGGAKPDGLPDPESVSASFDGATSIVAALESEDRQPCNEALTVEAWLKLDAAPAASGVIAQKQAAGGGAVAWRVAVSSARKLVLQIWAGGAQTEEVDPGAPALQTGKWYHVAVAALAQGIVSSPSGLSVLAYVDGEVSGPKPLTAALGAPASYEIAYGDGLKGSLAEVAVYCEGLLPDQIGTHLHGTSYFPPYAPTGLLVEKHHQADKPDCSEDPALYVACHHAVSATAGMGGVCQYCARRNCPGVKDRSAQIDCLSICDEPTKTQSHAGGCTPNMCLNGGTCKTVAPMPGLPDGGYECSCPGGFSGSNCEVSTPTAATGATTATSVHKWSKGAALMWLMNMGKDPVEDGVQGSALTLGFDYMAEAKYGGGEATMEPKLGDKVTLTLDGRTRNYEWAPFEVKAGTFPDDDDPNTKDTRRNRIYYTSIAIFSKVAKSALAMQFETGGAFVWMSGKNCIRQWGGTRGGLNDLNCPVEAGWNQMIIKYKEFVKIQSNDADDIFWSLTKPADAPAEEAFFRVTYPKRSAYPRWWTSVAPTKNAGFTVTFDFETYQWPGDGEFKYPKGKIAPRGKCGDADNGVGGGANGFFLKDFRSFTTTAGITGNSFDVCFLHPVCQQWRKVGAGLDLSGTAGCGTPPTCWKDLGGCMWKPDPEGTPCPGGICVNEACAPTATVTATCAAQGPACMLREKLSVTTAQTNAIVRGYDGRFEPWGGNGLPRTPLPIYASPGENGGYLVAWTVDDAHFTHSDQLGRLGRSIMRVSHFDKDLKRIPNKPDTFVPGGTLRGFVAAADGRFAVARWKVPHMFVERFEPDGTMKWSTKVADTVQEFNVGDSRLVSIPVGGEDYYALYHHRKHDSDQYSEIDVWGEQKRVVQDWCKPSFRHELAAHRALGEFMSICVGTHIRVRTWRKSQQTRDIHQVPTTDGRAAGDVGDPVEVSDGWWLPISATRTSTSTYSRADKLNYGLVRIKWEAGAWQFEAPVWITSENVVAPRVWKFGEPGRSTDLLVGWQIDVQTAGHQTAMPGEQQYKVGMFNTDDSKGDVGLLKDDKDVEVVADISDMAVWGVHSTGQIVWDEDGSAGWVYSWSHGGGDKWKYKDGSACSQVGGLFCDGPMPPVRNEPRTTHTEPGETHLDIVRILPPDFNCTDQDKALCHNESSCEKKFGRVTCQCPLGHANKPGTPEAKWGYVGMCEDKSCAKNPDNCGTNATCTDIRHKTKPYKCECDEDHPLGDPDDYCYHINRRGTCSHQSADALHWGTLKKMLHYGDRSTNLGGGIGKTDHFIANDAALEPRLGETGPGSQIWKPLEEDDGNVGDLTSTNWWTTAFHLALYSPKKQDVMISVYHNEAFRLWMGKGWTFGAAEVYNDGASKTSNITLSFPDPGWYSALFKFYDAFNGRDLVIKFVKPTTGETIWPMLGWCYDLPLIDECAENIHNCHPSASCTDTPKYFECDCPAGKPGDPPSGWNGDPTKGCVEVEGDPLDKGCLTKMLHYGSETYNIGGGADAEKFSIPMAEMRPVTGDTGPAAGEVWTRVERPDSNLPYGGNWHSDVFSFALFSNTDQTVVFVVETADSNNARAVVYLEGTKIFDGSTTTNVSFALKKGWNQVLTKHYVDYNYRLLKFCVPYNTLGWWYEKPRINECLNDTLNDCHQEANCVDTPSAYECHCKAGFAGDGRVECVKIEGEPIPDGCIKKTLRYYKKADDTASVGGGIGDDKFAACCGGQATLKPRTEEAPGAVGPEWWWGKWASSGTNGVQGNLVTPGQPNWYTDIFSWAVYSPKDQTMDLIVQAKGSSSDSRVWIDGTVANSASGGEKVTKVTLTKGWHQVIGKMYASFNGRTFTVCFNASNLGWAYDIPLINECQLPDKGGCHANATCVDTPQSFYCECKNGFAGDGVKTCDKIEGQALGCGKIKKMLHYGDETFNNGGGIDDDKFKKAGLADQHTLKPATGDAGHAAGQVWTRVERADGNLPYGGNWHGDIYAMAIYSPADGTAVKFTSYCQGSDAACRIWNDGAVIYDGKHGDGEKNVTVTLSKGWHQWIMKYYVNYNSRTFWIDILEPCTLGWFYEIPPDNAKCLAVTCKKQGECKEVGTCINNATGECSNPDRTDGAACDDGNTSTVDDACVAGECKGKDLCAGKSCNSPAECQEPGTCLPSTGLCVYTTMMNGASCDDGKNTTVDDVCTNGTCAGTDKCTGVTCKPLDSCHEVGICVHQTGFCTNPQRPDGALCNDSLPNTVEDICTAGQCKGVDKCLGVFCTPPPQCHGDGKCDLATGICVHPVLANGTFCDDSNAATIDDTCTNGFCAGKSPDEALCPSSCLKPAQCDEPPTCTGPGMVCTYNHKPNGYPCDDGDPKTGDDRCFQGNCMGNDKCLNKVCRQPADTCTEPGQCDPATGNCTNLPRPDGAACDDGDPNTKDDQCKGGVCGGADLCKAGCAAKVCHDAGTCAPATGACSYNTDADGTDCDLAGGTKGECASGTCQPKDPCKGVVCKAKDDCHDVGVCNRTTALCSNITRPAGVPCSQNTGVCKKGICTVIAPTAAPSAAPTSAPSVSPTGSPMSSPSGAPSASPANPTASPSAQPTKAPLTPKDPTTSPVLPTTSPTAAPITPTTSPQATPTHIPSHAPISPPTASPSTSPTGNPTFVPTQPPKPPGIPTASPVVPTASPSQGPTASPTQSPASPTAAPSDAPAAGPTAAPSGAPAAGPSAAPAAPTVAPSASPVGSPSKAPAFGPSAAPSASPTPPLPSAAPSAPPTAQPQTPGTPSRSPVVPPTSGPSASPSGKPTESPAAPTQPPSASPSRPPPTVGPSQPPAPAMPDPSVSPSAAPAPPGPPPTTVPSLAPLKAATPTAAPASPTQAPSVSPVKPGTPTAAPAPPSLSPSAPPQRQGPPTVAPSAAPQTTPSLPPVKAGSPTAAPVVPPSAAPTATPSAGAAPSAAPVKRGAPTGAPAAPSTAPSTAPAPPTASPEQQAAPSASPRPVTFSPTQNASTGPTPFDECTGLPNPCGKGLYASGETDQTCVDPDTHVNASGDFLCECTNGAKHPNGTAIGMTGGPAVCRVDECHPVNPCGDDQDCRDPDTTADKKFDYTCTCKETAPGSGGMRAQRTGTRARCQVDECVSLDPCGKAEVCVDANRSAASSSQSNGAVGGMDFVCSCADGTLPTVGEPANCTSRAKCEGGPCGADQDCSEQDNNFLCSCRVPYYGNQLGAPAECKYDECRNGSLAMCGAGQACSDPEPLSRGSFNCSCLPPFNGSRIGAPADCWHNDCRDKPCGDEQECRDMGEGHGSFRCYCPNGVFAMNRRAVCEYDECTQREDTKDCDLCVDPVPRPDSVGDYRCACRGGEQTHTGSPCRNAAAALDTDDEDAEKGSDWILVACIAGAVVMLACAGILWLQTRRKRIRKAKFAELAEAESGATSLQQMPQDYAKMMTTPQQPSFRHGSQALTPTGSMRVDPLGGTTGGIPTKGSSMRGSPRAHTPRAREVRGMSAMTNVSTTSARSGHGDITRV
eukprot:TRINITY_DN3977_c0_g1_i1.p1 TRINITY_DN3977_c0_g1~~TRINITY_DN3977_c0_g1_i1.p1  ORF type:complete len:4379 (+),score=1193.64 TRINITY_DN3977_c0_g1_i1:100-13137(+)